MVEQRFCKAKAGGSIPLSGSDFSKDRLGLLVNNDQQ